MEKPKLVIVGASGQMGRPIIERATREGYTILGAFVGPKDDTTHVHASDGSYIQCEKFNEINWSSWKKTKEKDNVIFLDVTHKSSIKDNFKNVYEKLEFPLIIGTIGIKKEDIAGVKFPVIIGSPNFALQLAEILDIWGNNLPQNFLEGIMFGQTESHQGPDPEKGFLGKTEFSGTADRMRESFEKLGGKMSYQTMIRDPKIQRLIGVKEEYLSGHGWHTHHFMSHKKEWGIKNVLNLSHEIISKARYGTRWLEPVQTILVKNRSAIFEVWNENYTFQLKTEHDPYNVWFSTNINGREPYIDGLFKAVLPEMIHSISCGENKIRDMFDIL